MIIACATNDGINFVTSHFGDADNYYLYKLTKKGCTFLKAVENQTEEEGVHADPKKAKAIANLLKNNDVQVGISRYFGPNIKRVVKHFIPILINEEKIDDGIRLLINQYDAIVNILEKGEVGFLKFGKESSVDFIPVEQNDFKK